MGHDLRAIVVPGRFDHDAADRWGLRPIELRPGLIMAHIDHYFTAYWQAATGTTGTLDVPAGVPAVFPTEAVVLRMVREITGRERPTFALLMTDYFGGVGGQWACAFEGERRTSREGARINEVLAALGVRPERGLDEFDTVGLGEHRSPPEYLERYRDLCDELGV